MTDYEDRRQPTSWLCPRCKARGRDSQVMKQLWGAQEYRLTCSDFSACAWSAVRTKEWVDSFSGNGIFKVEE